MAKRIYRKNDKGKMTKKNLKFADVYHGCVVVANLMGLNSETVRKHAKAGKIPAKQDKNGVWVFTHVDLVNAGVKPFATNAAPAAKVSKVNTTNVIFVLDRSGSMTGLYDSAKKNLDMQLDTLRKAADDNNKYYISVINFDHNVVTTAMNVDISNVGSSQNLYLQPSGNTRLRDAVYEAIRQANQLDSNGANAFLISVLTDGAENASTTCTEEQLRGFVKDAIAKDRYTFVYAGPKGSEWQAAAYGFLPGNVTTWEQTLQGSQFLGAMSNSSFGSYTQSRSAGVLKSESFYAQPVTSNATAFANKLDDKLDDVSKAVTVKRVDAGDPLAINKFCEKKFGSFAKGEYFYQLIESEKVQDHKKIIIQDTATGAFYSGWSAAKKLLGIPDFNGTVKVKPGNLGAFKVFVQSTSTNRKLTAGTVVVHLS